MVAPGRSIFICPLITMIIVDGLIERPHFPGNIIISGNCCFTRIADFVGVWPLRLALVAVMGPPTR
jgi:hypothetical protein